jgi:hypothetical protein
MSYAYEEHLDLLINDHGTVTVIRIICSSAHFFSLA